MKKKLGLMVTIVGIALGVSACGENQDATTVDETITVNFINQTGEDVGILKIRPAEDYDWSENLLEEEVWKQNYEMPVSLNGVLPETEEGWQVQMKFLDGTEEIWQGVAIQNNATAVFSYENEVPSVEIEQVEEVTE